MTTGVERPIHVRSIELDERLSDYPIDPLFLLRWSPRAFSDEILSEEDLLTIFEAARWAPSAFNIQPWRLVYSLRGDTYWDNMLALLDPYNSQWAGRAAALAFLSSDTVMPVRAGQEPQLSSSHSFDAGAAWASIAFQATLLGYHAHCMSGIDYDNARIKLRVPPRYRIEAAVAIGRRGVSTTLPESMQRKEWPSMRKPLSDIVFRGEFVDR